MLALIRLVLIGAFVVLSSMILLAICLCRPRNVKNVWLTAQLYHKIAWLLGVKVKVIGKENIPDGRCIFIANHQSNYDLFFLTAATPPGTVSIGKKSILYFPLFGLIYWLSGNILIDRGNKINAMNALQKAKERMLKNNASVWLFPEGTRNYGQGLLPFKTGAFHLARYTQLPVVPVVASTYYLKFKLNQRNNGEIVIKFLPPLPQPSQSMLIMAKNAQHIMEQEIAQLDGKTCPRA